MSQAHATARVARGFTLIELMVSMLLASLISLAVMGVLGKSAQGQRSAHATNDINQSGAYALTLLDKALRSAGSGFAQADYAYGCKLYASQTNAQILPRLGSDPLPPPFANVTTGSAGVFRLAPAVIAAGQTTPGDSGRTSDVLIVMSGQAGAGEAPLMFDGLTTASSLTVKSTTSVAVNDALLVVDQQPTAIGPASCLLTQASAVAGSKTITLGGTYYASTISSVNLVDYTSAGAALHLGNPGNNTAPTFSLIGVGDGSTLFSADLLKMSSTAAQPLAAGVFELHALYGRDTNRDGVVDTWTQPSASGFTVAELMDGTALAATKLQQIKAIRVGLILRSDYADSSQSAPASLTMFSDLDASLTFTRSLSTAERLYRYRVVETTVPLRNPLLL